MRADGDCTVRPIASVGINTALGFYPATPLCTWSLHDDCDVSLVDEAAA